MITKILLFAVVLLVLGVGYGLLFVRSKLRRFSKSVFGTETLMEGINRQADILAETPKSVSSMTRLMEPQILRDFPDFSWNEFKHKAENMLTSALLAITSEDMGRLTADASETVRQQIANRIAANQMDGVKEVFSDIHIHRTEIANYSHAGGSCVIKIQSAIEYYYYKEKNEKVIKGQKERKTQTKYNVELLYIQDIEKVGDSTAVGANCPNCGAPITTLGEMYCEYCKTAVTPVNIKVWSLHKIDEVDANHV